MFRQTKNAFRAVVDTLFPLCCVACGSHGALCCESCMITIRINPHLVRLDFPKELNVLTCVEFKHKVVAPLIYAFKYDGMSDACEYFARIFQRMPHELQNTLRRYDMVLPIPLHRRRICERGYSQNTLLARSCFGAEKVCDTAIMRTRYTESQTGLTKTMRAKNIDGCFKVENLSFVIGKTIVLVDDVITTGATIKECARVLFEAGAKEVRGFAIARD